MHKTYEVMINAVYDDHNFLLHHLQLIFRSLSESAAFWVATFDDDNKYPLM